jgi:hypothetical protein
VAQCRSREAVVELERQLSHSLGYTSQ